MKTKAHIVFDFLANLSGFLKIEDTNNQSHLVHLETGVKIFVPEIDVDDIMEEDWNLILDIGGNSYVIAYIEVVDFYIAKHLQLQQMIKTIDPTIEFSILKEELNKQLSQ